MIVIGFTGPAGAGKDTAAHFLAEHMEDRGLKVRVQAWADKLKVMAARSLGFNGDEQECIDFCDWLKVHGKIEVRTLADQFERTANGGVLTGREFLEFMGTEGGRDVLGMNVWVDAALPAPGTPEATTWRAVHGFPNVVIDTTTRFPNEVERIRRWGGQVWRIERPEAELRALTTGHASRTGIPRDECEVVLQNDSDLDALAASVQWALGEAEASGDIVVPV